MNEMNDHNFLGEGENHDKIEKIHSNNLNV